MPLIPIVLRRLRGCMVSLISLMVAHEGAFDDSGPPPLNLPSGAESGAIGRNIV